MCGDDAFFLRLALVEGEVKRAKGLVGAEDFDDAVGEGVDDFGAEEGAVEDEVAGLVEYDVDPPSHEWVLNVTFNGQASPKLDVFELLQSGASLLHFRQGEDRLVVCPVKLPRRKVKHPYLSVGKGEGCELRASR